MAIWWIIPIGIGLVSWIISENLPKIYLLTKNINESPDISPE